MTKPPPIRGIVETVLYTDDVAASRAFYTEILELPIVWESDALLVFAVGTSQNLLVFLRGHCDPDKPFGDSFIPGHRGDGPTHMAFHVSIADYDVWKSVFEERGIPIISEVRWAAGGRALYFNDPSGNVLELTTPGNWQNF
jgi:catechol 2,3-dioxygenase-like lactoylglutathione lyase family enzyme